MNGFIGDIEHLTDDNENFRHVIYTGQHLQLVLMTLAPGEDIGEEVHLTHDQFFRIEAGKGHAVIDGVTSKIKRDFAVIVPAGAHHNIVNSGDKPMRLYTLYAPPQHKDGFVAATRMLADASPEKYDGVSSE